jgi:signal transduction histidine kinase/ligand-binding sensor domain-containing protein/ActR/RegA family two-component response regulator
MTQDYLGFVWVGTEEGLNRIIDYGLYDQHKFDRKDSTTLSNNDISAIFEDSKKRLWVGTMNGLNLYNRELNNWTRIQVPHEQERIGNYAIHHISEDPRGDLWIICNDHLVKLSGETLEEELILQASNSKGKSIYLSDVAYFKSQVMVATFNGLYKVQGKELVSTDLGESNPITTLLPLGNELWMGTAGKGIIRYDHTRDTQRVLGVDNKQTPLTSNHINHLYLVDQKEVWAATIDGITVIDLATEESKFYRYNFDNAYSLSDKVIRYIFQDRQGVVWMTTPNSGVNYYHAVDNLFDYYGQSYSQGTENDLMDYSIFSMFSEGEGQVWLGSRVGISRFRTDKGKFDHFPFPESFSGSVSEVSAIKGSNSERLWLGTNSGLLSWNCKTETYERVQPDVLSGLKVNTIMLDDKENVWLGTESNGVKIYAMASKVVRDVEVMIDGMSVDYIPAIQAIRQLKDGRVLVGSERGLYLYKDGVLEQLHILPGSEDIPVAAIYESKKYGIMLATQQDGMLLLDDQFKVKQTYALKNGVISDDIRAIVEDDDGALWLTSNAGVSKLEMNLADTSKTVIKNYDISDGLQSNHFSARAGLKIDDGRVLLAGVSGLTIFHPDFIIDYEIPMSAVFTSFAIKGEKVKVGEEDSPLKQDISLTNRIELKARQNDFTLTYGALDHIRPGDVEYRYKLEGVNDDWVVQKSTGIASFQNIPPGKDLEFVLQTKSKFSDWSEEKHLTIYVEPYFYETWFFRVVLILLVLSIIGLIFWLRNKRMVQKREELENLVQERSVELREEIRERENAEKKLKVALAEAENANEVKSRFLANMSHEIRTPLNGIMGLTQLSLETEEREEKEDILNTLAVSARSLKVIVDDILDIAKIEAGTLDFASEVFSVKELLEEVVSSFRIQVDEKQLYLKKWVLPTIPNLVLGDANRVRQVLINLVSNAIKFTHSGGVTILAEGLDQGKEKIEIWFTVTDTGIGMPDSQLNRIFESFTQVDNGDTRAYGGTGLGLSICKELVERMGGEIWAESDENSGSIFRFYIKVEEVLEEEVRGSVPVKDYERAEEVSGDSKTILLVEDNATNQKVASKMLQRKGFKVICADNGINALEILKEQRFDLILMDLQMPEMDGYVTTQKIRESEAEDEHIPIVALTAAAMVGEREKCLEAGMDDYLSKPVDYSLLIKTVNQQLDSNVENV